jgi:hypothetical protein
MLDRPIGGAGRFAFLRRSPIAFFRVFRASSGRLSSSARATRRATDSVSVTVIFSSSQIHCVTELKKEMGTILYSTFCRPFVLAFFPS